MADLSVLKVVVVVFLSVAIYNFLELNVQIFTIFKRRSGLYFWSFTIATWGILFNSVGYLLKHLEVTKNGNIHATIILIGWCSMVSGQSVVLYSRLHIVMHNARKLRAVLIMIIANAIWLHIPIIILVYGSNSTNPGPFQGPYSVYEKIQLTVFVVQELIISGLYVYETVNLLKLEDTIGNNGTRTVLYHLIYVNILVILLDFSIVGLEFANLYEIQTAWKPLVYSAKLKLEFSILNRLVDLTRSARSGDSRSYSNAARSGGLALGTMKTRNTLHERSVARGADQTGEWEVHVGGGKANSAALPSTVIKTTEVKIQSHSRRRSETSLAESKTEILPEAATHDGHEIERGSASSVSSDIAYGRFANSSWQ
ncbi:integral membrane protein [Stagonosporopsis vannaccii]|nr:integral membrane protein [Stagonosporopsis vannaccii]